MHSRARRTAQILLILTLLAGVAAGASAWYLQTAGVAPRALAMYIERRAEGHRPLVVDSVGWVARALTVLDRGDGATLALPELRIGAQPRVTAQDSAGQEVLLGTSAEVRRAIEQARPGDVLTLLPGHYLFGQPLALARPGRPDSKITLRARVADSAVIEFDTVQGFVVTGSDWRVENLTIVGACTRQTDCEHAFHVVGAAQRFAALNNTISDFNAHFKINGEDGRFPDDGLIEGNTLTNGAARQTDSAVTPIDMVGVSRWTVRRNLISDFIKTGGDRVSYGAFAKGGGAHNLFEQNMVLCEARLRGFPGQRVGLSLGGGGTGKEFCRDRKCITEQDQGVIQANLVAACSDVGIYLNSAAGSKVLHNTLIDTAGIDARYAETVATVSGNLVDGAIRARNDAVLHLGENRVTPTALLYAGYHPVRSLFASTADLELGWDGAPPRLAAPTGLPDLCGGVRPALAAMGAFEEFAQCRRTLMVR
jgi:hypothetical protein